jgi:hypothetical protein
MYADYNDFGKIEALAVSAEVGLRLEDHRCEWPTAPESCHRTQKRRSRFVSRGRGSFQFRMASRWRKAKLSAAKEPRLNLSFARGAGGRPRFPRLPELALGKAEQDCGLAGDVEITDYPRQGSNNSQKLQEPRESASTQAQKTAHFSADQPAHDPELTALIDAWPTLPEAIRAGISAMIRAAGG